MVKNSINTKIAVMTNDITYIRKSIDNIKERLEDDFVTKTEFNPVRMIVYSLVGLILMAAIGAILRLVIK
jgi:hypothetical protein